MAGDGLWRKTEPVAGTKARLVSGLLRTNAASIESALDSEHIFSGTAAATQTGAHRQGSARCFFQDSAPATAPDGSAFASTDLGMLWFDTNSSPDNILYVLTATTPTWTPVSTEIIATLLASARVFGNTLGVTGDFIVGANKVIINATTGATSIDGVLGVTGDIEPTSFSTVNGGFIDEDSMATNSATKVPSQQSVKAYVDNQIDSNVGSETISPLSYTNEPTVSLTNGFVIKNELKTVSFVGGTGTFTYTTPFASVSNPPVICRGESMGGDLIYVTSYNVSSITIGKTGGNASYKVHAMVTGK